MFATTSSLNVPAEIDTAVAEGRVHLPVHLAEGQKLPYLSAVIKETQRLHPGILWPLPRYVPEVSHV